MANRRSLLTWGFILLILVGTGLLAVAWPVFQGNLSSSSSAAVATGVDPVIIQLPIPIMGLNSISLQSWQLMLILGLLVTGAVITTGIVFMLISYVVSWLINRTENQEDYQQNVAELDKQQQASLKQEQATHPTHTTSDVVWVRWSVIATGLALILFAVSLANLFAYSLYPAGRTMQDGEIVNMAANFSLVAIAIVVLGMIIGISGREPAEMDDAGKEGIPWDSIAIVLSGLLVVGVGIGAMLALNAS